jgi:CubicO group peptidase (beta-lactamase class C family)
VLGDIVTTSATKMAAIIDGYCDSKFSSVYTLLEHFIELEEELGASIVVNINGQNVVDIWGGYFDETRQKRWERNTIVNVFSTTKTVTALAALMLIDRGIVGANARVSDYWPEYAANGKENTLVRQILCHAAGVPSWDRPMTIDDVCDVEKSTAILAAEAPWWTPGTRFGYHSFTMGHLIAEIVRRRTGKSLKQFVAEDIAAPLQADFQIGAIEEDWPRVSDVIPPPNKPQEDASNLEQLSISDRVKRNPPYHPGFANTRAWRLAELGGGNGHGNARSLARIMSTISLGGKVEGTRILSQQSINEIYQEQILGIDLVIGRLLRFGLGFGLTGKGTFVDWIPEGRVCFWGGYGGSFVIMDADRRLTISYVMNKLGDVGLGTNRTKAYVKAIYDALGVSL